MSAFSLLKGLAMVDAVFYLLLLLPLLFFFGAHCLLLRPATSPTGPSALPIIGHLHLLKKPLHRALADLSRQWGPVLHLRFGARPVLVVSSPAAAQDCLSTHDLAFANRPRGLLAGKHFGSGYTTIGWAPYGPFWRELRRITAVEVFSHARALLFAPIRADEVAFLAKDLFSHSSDGGSFAKAKLRPRLLELTFNLMMRMIADKRYYGERAEASDDAQRFRDTIEETFLLMGTSNLADYLSLLRWIDVTGVEKKMIRLESEKDALLQTLIEERRKNEGDGKKVLIDVLLQQQKTDPDYYTDQLIRGLFKALLNAGTDTSALTMEWAMALMLNHPDDLRAAQAEIDDKVGHSRLVEEADLPELPFLNSVIHETLRLCPTGPLLLPHESSSETAVGGRAVPAGTMLLVNVWAVHRDPEAWLEPEEFRPARFHGGGVEGEKERFRFLPFGSGRRVCPGSGLAIRVVGLALAVLIQGFEWARVEEDLVDLREGPGLTMPMAHPLEARYKPREEMVPLLSQL